MSRNSIYRVGLVAAIVSTVSWFLFVYGQMSLPALSEIEDPLEFFQEAQDARSVFLLYGWGGLVATLLCIPYIMAFYQAIKDKASLVSLATVTSLIGIVLASLGFMKPLTLIHAYAPKALEANVETLPMLKVAAATTVELFELPWNLGSFLVFGLGFALIAFYAWRTGTGPKWLNGVGLFAGLTGIVWLTPYFSFPEGLAVMLRVLNILGIMIWSIGLSIVLDRR